MPAVDVGQPDIADMLPVAPSLNREEDRVDSTGQASKPTLVFVRLHGSQATEQPCEVSIIRPCECLRKVATVKGVKRNRWVDRLAHSTWDTAGGW